MNNHLIVYMNHDYIRHYHHHRQKPTDDFVTKMLEGMAGERSEGKMQVPGETLFHVETQLLQKYPNLFLTNQVSGMESNVGVLT